MNTELKKPVSEENARFAIDGAIEYGKQGINPPPSADHWLIPYWEIGRKLSTLSVDVAPVSVTDEPTDLNSIELYHLQMAGISSAAFGYWKEGDSIHLDYDTLPLHDVAALYAKYEELYKQVHDRPSAAAGAEPAFNIWSDDDGDTWLEHPADAEFVHGRKVGDTYELLASWRSERATYRVTKAPDDESDDYEVECISPSSEAQAAPVDKRIAELEAARIAYASEFALDVDGEPDVDNIHANIRKLKADLAAALSQQPAVPNGWQLVPIEPTMDMVIAGFESKPDPLFVPEHWEEYQEMTGCQQAAFRAKLCWKAMIAAAPAAPMQEDSSKKGGAA